MSPSSTANKRLRPIIRVFVSSTFSDLKLERDALQQRVFPKLEQLCRKEGFQFQAVDLRWGVSTEAGLDHRTMRICFEELRRSQEVSPEPNFLILLGNRYGWRPLPEEISADEFRSLEEAAGQIGAAGEQPLPVDILRQWYRLDENSLTPVYILQPRRKPNVGDPGGRDYTAAETWREVEQVLWQIINRAFPADRLKDRFASPPPATGAMPPIVRFQASATEQEIWCGALGDPHAGEHVLALFREIDQAQNTADAQQFSDYFDIALGQINVVAQAALRGLKDEIKKRLGSNAVELPPAHLVSAKEPGGPATVSADHIDALCREVESRLTAIIDRQITQYWNGPQASDGTSGGPTADQRADRELRIERDEHRRFGDECGPKETFVGRQDQLRQIVDYLGNDSRWPLVIHGDSGCGKSALAARAYQEIPPQKKPIIRFLGVTPRSCDLVPLLRSLCQELRARHPIAESLSSDVRELTDEFRYHLGAATVEQPVILFLDALDQLSEADDSRQLFWIPSGELPSHVKIVVSCASDPGENDPRGQPYVALQRRSLPSANMLNLNALSLDDAKTLLFDRWLPAAGRKTRDAQRRLVEETLESAAACRQPLYLKLLFEETRLWRSWDEPRAPGTSVPELLEQLCQRLSGPENHGELLVRLVLGYLAAARRGLSETEILEILFADPDYKRELDEASRRNRHILPTEPPRIPVAIWSRLRSDLAPYLTERAAPGSNVLTLYHRQISEWVRACYLDAAGWNPHARLAGFFSRQDYFLEPVEDQRARSQRIPPTARPANIRKADELPYQLLEAARHADPESNAPEAGEWNVAADLLSDWQFLEAKAEAQLVFELVEDFASAVSVMPKDHPRRRILTLIEGAIRNDVHFIDRLPTALFQCIWNLSSWDDGEQMLLDCLRDWASGKEQATPAFGWLRSLRPPAVSVHDSPSARISADGSSVLSVSLDKTGTCGLLGTKQGTVLLFDTASGRTTGTVTADQRAIVACSLSRNGFLALACSVDRVVRAYRRDSGYRLCSVWTAPGDPSACAISDSGRYACVGTRHGEVAIFDVPTATAVATYRHKDRSKIIWCAVDERRNRTVSLDADCRAVLTPLDEPAAKKWLKGPQSSALSAALLEDRNELVGVFTNGEIWFWDLNEMRVRKVQSVRLGEFSPHSDNLAFAVFGGSHVLVEDFLGHAGVVAWSLETGEPSGAVRCQGGRLTCMTAVPDGSVMLCGTANGLAHCWKTAAVESAFASDPPGVVWDLASHRTIDCERLHRNEFASIDAAGRITIWELGRTAAPTEEFSLSDLPGGDRNALLVGKRRPAGADGREPAAVWSPPARMAYLRKSGHWAIALCDGPILLCRRNSWEKISQSESRASGDVLDLSLSPDEAYLVVVEQNGQIASYRCPELKMVRSFSSAPLLCARGRWTADKLAVLFGPAQGGLSIWHAEDQAVERIVESSQQFTACDLSAGGSFAWGTAGGSAGVGRLGKNWQMELHARHRSRIAACALSPKADLLATTGQDGTVLVQGVSSNAFEGVFPLSDRGNCLCWLDETTLAVGTESGRVEILAVTRGSV